MNKSLLRRFLFALAESPVASLLVANPPETLDNDLVTFFLGWSTNPRLDARSLRSWGRLLSLAVAGVPAENLWPALIDIVRHPSPKSSAAAETISTPRSSPRSQSVPTRLSTPIRGCSGSHGPETHLDLDPRIRSELDGLVYPNVPEFFNTYFKDQEWSLLAKDAVDRCTSTRLSPAGWITWPTAVDQGSVIDWFSSCINDLLREIGATRNFAFSPNKPLVGYSAGRKADIFLRGIPTNGVTTHDWTDVLVVGELKKSTQDTLAPALVVELANYIRVIFKTQPCRRFIHAFTLCGDMMRCWIFHRGGVVTSSLFSINKNPTLFLSIVVGYAFMSRSELGYDPTISVGESELHVTLGSARCFELKMKPFFNPPSIASRGTTCWEARQPGETDFNYVCKDAWRYESYTSEGSLLLEAQEAGVEGLVQCVAHEEVHIDSILDDISGHVMKGLEMSGIRPLNLRVTESRSTSSRATSVSRPSQSRKSSTQSIESRKRPASDSAPAPLRKRSKCSTGVTTPCFNRVHTRLITIRGRSITTFKSSLELTVALRDAIIGHRALLRHGILHRDISLSNIMLAVSARRDGRTCFLLDLDLALRLDDTADSTTHHRTGTMEFMAIGALAGEPHTYRHDLESFLYVLIWLCIHHLPGNKLVRPAPTVLAAWAGPSFLDAAARKRGDMEPGGFDVLVSHFAASAEDMKDLARGVRQALFPWRGRVWTGTDPEYEPVYQSILDVFDAVIGEMESTVQMERELGLGKG